MTDIQDLGASIVLISPQTEKYSKQAAEKHNLTIPVLSDKGNAIAAQFGVVFRLQDDLKELYDKFGINLEKYNDENSWTLPMPSRFIVDQQGTIISADANPDYTKRPEPTDIIKILKES